MKIKREDINEAIGLVATVLAKLEEIKLEADTELSDPPISEQSWDRNVLANDCHEILYNDKVLATVTSYDIAIAFLGIPALVKACGEHIEQSVDAYTHPCILNALEAMGVNK